MSPENLQGWVAVIGGLLAAILGLSRYFNYRSRRDRLAAVGASFALTIEALASDNETSRMAGAVLLRRFFDRHTEQGGRGRPYVNEAIEVMAGMLRQDQPARVQKVLADGLRYARTLQTADLQNCDLSNAYLGKKQGDEQRSISLVRTCTEPSARGPPSRLRFLGTRCSRTRCSPRRSSPVPTVGVQTSVEHRLRERGSEVIPRLSCPAPTSEAPTSVEPPWMVQTSPMLRSGEPSSLVPPALPVKSPPCSTTPSRGEKVQWLLRRRHHDAQRLLV